MTELGSKYRGADKSLARPGRKQARKHVRDARDFNNIETRAVVKFLFLPGKAPKEIHAILTETLACFIPGRAKDLSAPLYIEDKVFMFNCKIVYYSIVYFVGVVLWNFYICVFPLHTNAEPCKTLPKQQTCTEVARSRLTHFKFEYCAGAIACRGWREERGRHFIWSVAMERWNVQQHVICVRSFGDIAWPARSPDLTVPDYFLWGFLKDRVFRRRIMTIQELKQAMTKLWLLMRSYGGAGTATSRHVCNNALM